jgi:hypothetical protein
LLLTPLILAAAMLIPAPTTAAAAYPVRVVHNYCDGQTVHLKMSISARGYTDANKLSIDSWAQRRVSGSWQTVYNWQRAVYAFEVDGNRHTLTSFRSYHGTRSHEFRIVFKLRAWKGRHVLHSTVYRSVAC